MFYICGFQGTVHSRIFSYQSLYSVSDLTVSGDKEIRTLDPLLARQVLSQLSYIPVGFLFIQLNKSK